MSGICSAHQGHDPNCRLCNTTPGQLFGEDVWANMQATAEAAGLVACKNCEFKFYLTTDTCPACHQKYEKKIDLS